MKKKHLVFLIAGVVSRLAISAEPAQSPPGMPPGFPSEVLSVCESKAAGSTAQLNTPDGHVIKGKCQLVLMPEQMPMAPKLSHRPAMKPMPPFMPIEAFNACKNQVAGSASRLIAPDGQTIKGTCQLVLLPDHPPGPPAEAFNACKDQAVGG
ncbi:MAG: hypothetical protein ACXWJD_04950, partial [Burkholderiaceae bacterium]